MNGPPEKTPLPALTALRFFAALYVLLFHFFAAHDPHPSTLSERLLDAGFSAVSCFFLLSGFLLAYTHPCVPHPLQFFRARFARIYPLYAFSLLWVVPFQLHVHGIPHARLAGILLANILLLQDWFPSITSLLNEPAWTLSCEAFFYLLFPAAILWIARRQRHWGSLLGGCAAFQLIPPALNQYWLASKHPALSHIFSEQLQTPLARLGEFLAGIVLGLHFTQRQHDTNRPPQQDDHPRWLLPCALVLCLCALLCNGSLPHEVFRNGWMLLPYSLLIWALAGSRSRFLASAPLQLGGEVSYGIYLLQMPFAGTLLLLRSRLAPTLVPHVTYMLLIIPFAWLTYRLIEKPCRALILRNTPLSASKPIPTP